MQKLATWKFHGALLIGGRGRIHCPKDRTKIADVGSFIPSFFEIKESAGREFFPKRIGVFF
jgi:hypothetical protein